MKRACRSPRAAGTARSTRRRRGPERRSRGRRSRSCGPRSRQLLGSHVDRVEVDDVRLVGRAGFAGPRRTLRHPADQPDGADVDRSEHRRDARQDQDRRDATRRRDRALDPPRGEAERRGDRERSSPACPGTPSAWSRARARCRAPVRRPWYATECPIPITATTAVPWTTTPAPTVIAIPTIKARSAATAGVRPFPSV